MSVASQAAESRGTHGTACRTEGEAARQIDTAKLRLHLAKNLPGCDQGTGRSSTLRMRCSSSAGEPIGRSSGNNARPEKLSSSRRLCGVWSWSKAAYFRSRHRT